MRLCEQQNSGTVIIHVKLIIYVQTTNSFWKCFIPLLIGNKKFKKCFFGFFGWKIIVCNSMQFLKRLLHLPTHSPQSKVVTNRLILEIIGVISVNFDHQTSVPAMPFAGRKHNFCMCRNFSIKKKKQHRFTTCFKYCGIVSLFEGVGFWCNVPLLNLQMGIYVTVGKWKNGTTSVPKSFRRYESG